jgi:hypothetical protein
MSNKIEFLSRRNKGRKLLPDYVSALSEITGVDANVFLNSILDLESSDRIYEIYISNIKSINSGSYTSPFIKASFEKSSQILAEIQGIAKPISKNHKFYLITKFSDLCGMVEINFDDAISHLDKLIAYDGDSFGLVSADSHTGVMVDMYTEVNGKILYDFVAYF